MIEKAEREKKGKNKENRWKGREENLNGRGDLRKVRKRLRMRPHEMLIIIANTICKLALAEISP